MKKTEYLCGMIDYLRWAICRFMAKYVKPLLDKKYHLQFSYILEMFKGKYEIEVEYIDEICKEDRLAIDVGANWGFYTYKLSKKFQKVYAFEPNQDVTKQIENYKSKKIKLVNESLSSSSEDKKLYIPVVDGLELHGWAEIESKSKKNADRYVEKKVKSKKMDDYELKNVDFIKVDVEGHEIEVLRGGMKTIYRERPVILIEIRNDNLGEVRELLEGAGYIEQSLADIAGVEGSSQNYIFVPEK